MRAHSVHTSHVDTAIYWQQDPSSNRKAKLICFHCMLTTHGSLPAYNTWVHSSLQHLGPFKLTTPGSLHAYNTLVPSSLQHLGLFKLTTPGSLQAYNTWVPSSLQYLGLFKLTTPGYLQAYNTWVPSSLQHLGPFAYNVFEGHKNYVFQFDIILTHNKH